MIIDGEELSFHCKNCGKEFKHIIGYGPVCPMPWLRNLKLKENPPKCPQCGSLNVKRKTFLGGLFGL